MGKVDMCNICKGTKFWWYFQFFFKSWFQCYLNGQHLIKNLAAVKGKLKAEKQRSEKANDNKNGVVECFLKVGLHNNTKTVNEFPTHPNTLQITAAHAATLDMSSSNNFSVKSPKSGREFEYRELKLDLDCPFPLLQSLE